MTVKKNMLKKNGEYENKDDDNYDVNLTSKDQEVPFSGKYEDDDELDTKLQEKDLTTKDLDTIEDETKPD